MPFEFGVELFLDTISSLISVCPINSDSFPTPAWLRHDLLRACRNVNPPNPAYVQSLFRWVVTPDLSGYDVTGIVNLLHTQRWGHLRNATVTAPVTLRININKINLLYGSMGLTIPCWHRLFIIPC